MADMFFGDALAAGAILTGFCGTFLSFRIEREARYHRDPASSPEPQQDSLSHLTASFLILISASIITAVFGTALPLLGLAGIKWVSIKSIIAGLFSGLVLLGGYFYAELVHYDIRPNKLENDKEEWKRERPIVVITFTVAVILFLIMLFTL